MNVNADRLLEWMKDNCPQQDTDSVLLAASCKSLGIYFVEQYLTSSEDAHISSYIMEITEGFKRALEHNILSEIRVRIGNNVAKSD